MLCVNLSFFLPWSDKCHWLWYVPESFIYIYNNIYIISFSQYKRSNVCAIAHTNSPYEIDIQMYWTVYEVWNKKMFTTIVTLSLFPVNAYTSLLTLNGAQYVWFRFKVKNTYFVFLFLEWPMQLRSKLFLFTHNFLFVLHNFSKMFLFQLWIHTGVCFDFERTKKKEIFWS